MMFQFTHDTSSQTAGPSWFLRHAGILLFLAAAISLATAQTSAIANEPPRNPFLADSPWPMSHRNPYNQASSPHAGPTSAGDAVPKLLEGEPVPITLAVSQPYPDGRYAVWGTTLKDVIKVDMSGGRMTYIDCHDRTQTQDEAISGAYSLIDNEGTYFVPRNFEIESYGDKVPGQFKSPIAKLGHFKIPPEYQGVNDAIVGINLTYDGRLVFVTRRGVVGCVTRDFQSATYLRLPRHESDDVPGDDASVIEISNSIAVDETGGIFVTTNTDMIRIQWQPAGEGKSHAATIDYDVLSMDWSVPYRSSGRRETGRLGVGSGTTPTLMGFGDDDRFVVIGDGQTLMHIVLFWRDAIPADWKGLPGRDRRIAAEVPATFGQPDARRSTTEQSLTVRGHEIVAVSNLYGRLSPLLRRFARRRLGGNIHHLTIYRSNQPEVAPYGVEKFQWNHATRQLESAWANRDISCPNGIPTMSEATGLLYCIGQRDGHWTLEGIDWQTGETAFHRELSSAADHNSFYAATEIGPYGNVMTGTFGGMLNFASRHPRFHDNISLLSFDSKSTAR